MKHFFLFTVIAVLSVACSQQEDPIEREKKEMKAFFDDSKLLVPYKGVKIALRVDYNDQSANNVKISGTALKTLSTVSGLVMRDSLPQGISGMYDMYKQIKSLYALKKEINGINEDDLPTIYKKFSAIEKNLSGSSTMMASIEKAVFGNYNNSTEHFLLGCIWFILPGAPPDIYVYEAAQVNVDEISKPDLHIFASLLKALVCEQKEWHYTSEKSSTEYIDYLTAHKGEILDATTYLDSVPGTDPEKRFYELRSVGYALRGYARHNSDREKEANEDFDHFVDDFDKSAVENKELCFLSAYLCIKNSKPEKAETFLAKMEKMNAYDDYDKKTVEELRVFIKDKDGKDFNKYFDSFSLTRIAFNYLYQVSQKSDMAKQLKSNQQTKDMMALPGKMNQAFSQSGDVLNTDSLVSGAGSLVKRFF
jgi:hypothetical protein